jgi:hypothetical protein
MANYEDSDLNTMWKILLSYPKETYKRHEIGLSLLISFPSDRQLCRQEA